MAIMSEMATATTPMKMRPATVIIYMVPTYDDNDDDDVGLNDYEIYAESTGSFAPQLAHSLTDSLAPRAPLHFTRSLTPELMGKIFLSMS